MELFKRLFEHLDADVERVIGRYEGLNAEFPVVAYDDAVATIEDLLARGLAVGVVTSAGEIARRQMLEVGIPLTRLTLVQTATETEFHKPDPRVFQPALGRLAAAGTPREAVAYVGDSLSDHRAAYGAKLRFVGVHGRTTPEAEFQRVGARSVAALKELVHDSWQF